MRHARHGSSGRGGGAVEQWQRPAEQLELEHPPHDDELHAEVEHVGEVHVGVVHVGPEHVGAEQPDRNAYDDAPASGDTTPASPPFATQRSSASTHSAREANIIVNSTLLVVFVGSPGIHDASRVRTQSAMLLMLSIAAVQRSCARSIVLDSWSQVHSARASEKSRSVACGSHTFACTHCWQR
jgi:hypothetical protein